MKSFSVIFILSTIISCNKTGILGDSSKIPVNNCIEYKDNPETVRLCFDSLLSDSRCPANAVCVWQGTATAKFSFHKDNMTYPVTLATESTPQTFPRDTIIEGYKIELLNVLPYPGTHPEPVPYTKIKAEVKVTHL